MEIRRSQQRSSDEAAARLRSRGEIEAAVSLCMTRFEQEYMGRGPKAVQSFLIRDMILVRLIGVLTAAEQNLVKSLPADKGRDLLKQVRTHLIETARASMTQMIEEIVGIRVASLHHDISTTTGEEIVVFTLSDAPVLRGESVD
jgi:uncharacterized protein YbcI